MAYENKGSGMTQVKPLIGFAIVEDCTDDMSDWSGYITYPDPRGANLAWMNPIKMIEYSAFVELQEKYREVVATLKFYAEPMNYTIDDYYGISGEMSTRCILYNDLEERNDVSRIAGRRARETLKEIGELNEST